MAHTSVLLRESIEALTPAIAHSGVVVDGTLGAGGHTEAIKKAFPGVRVIAIDKDEGAIERSKERLSDFDGITFVQHSFGQIGDVLDMCGMREVDAVLLDIGFSSDQIGPSGRGFSFQYDEPLLMTLGTGKDAAPETAMDIVNLRSEKDITEILKDFGEESHASLIAKAIVIARKKNPITTTAMLAQIVDDAVGKFYKRAKIHPATKTFQALRIAVNDELGELSRGIDGAFAHLKKGGRLAIITFHSLEDRIVKQAFNEYKKNNEGKVVTKKPIIPTDEEIFLNRRSRSAKLRVIEKI